MRARRVFPTEARRHLDPFVLCERFYIEPHQGFDTHPHRGFEIVSYMLEGGMAHDDSMGHSSVAREGDAMRVTTGSGMEHSELPDDDAPCSGLQLWINLPRERKTVDPGYEDADSEELPTEDVGGATVTTVVGEGSPLDLWTPVEYLDVRVSGEWTWEVPDGWSGFLYCISGSGTLDGHAISEAQCLTVEDGASLALSGPDLRVAAVSGEPHDQPIRQRGPFVE